MKERTAFREQITGYDCVPTSFINALVYLYKRVKIPTEVVREIYASTLDDNKGTSSGAVESLCNRLNRIHNEEFKIKCTLKKGREVNFDGPIKANTCWLICVWSKEKEGHYVTAFHKKDGFLYCFDPYYNDEEKNKNNWEIGSFDSGCNLKINLSHLNKTREEAYCAGIKNERELVIITKKV